MPTSDKKRLSDTPLSADTKRQRVSALTNTATPSSTNVFDISVFMEDEFNVFPEPLRETIQEQHEALLTNLVRRHERGLFLKTKSEFTITRKVLSQRDKEYDFKVTRPERYSNISLANQAILQEFKTKVPRRKSMIMELRLEAYEQPIANPALAQRHSVRNGEMGWAFDKFGCLSLHVTNVRSSGLRHESIWVERVDPITVKDPTTVKKDPATVEMTHTMLKKEDTADKAPSTVNPSMVNPSTVNPPTINAPLVNPTTASNSTSNSSTVKSTAAKVKDDEDDCCIIESPKATKGSKWTTFKESTAIKKETIANDKEATADKTKPAAGERRPMAHKAPTITDVADEDDDDDCVIVDRPNAAK